MRKSKPKKRILLPDPKFKETLVTRFVNYMMYDGKKNLAYTIFYDAVEQVETRTKENGLEMWRKALNNVMPTVEVKSRRVGGATFQVPTEVRPDRRIAVGSNWLIQYSRRRGEIQHRVQINERLTARSFPYKSRPHSVVYLRMSHDASCTTPLT